MASNITSSQPAQQLHPDSAVASLISLSMAAASAMPAAISNPGSHIAGSSTTASSNLNGPTPPLSSSVSNGQSYKQHRRLSSTGKTRRRLSDARDAASRPLPATLSTSATAALSLASLSLSTSPPLGPGIPSGISAALNAAGILQPQPPSLTSTTSHVDVNSMPIGFTSDSNSLVNPSSAGTGSLESGTTTGGDASTASTPIPIANGKYKKRGVDHKCESCSKIYRHPSCLIKHRWEHTPHWREASKFVLSKHQQVQLLEAAAILSHISPREGTSLPEDRSLWPSFLSGGALPPPEGATFPTSLASANVDVNNEGSGTASAYSLYPVSSSVPAQTYFSRASSTGPRLHDYTIPASAVTGSQVRPGLVGVPNSSSLSTSTPTDTASATATQPMPVPTHGASVANHHHRRYSYGSYRSSVVPISESWGAHSYSSSSYSYGTPAAYSYQSSGGYYGAPSAERTGSGGDAGVDARVAIDGSGVQGGVSRSRSGSTSAGSPSLSLSISASASGEGSRSDDEEVESIDVDIEGADRDHDHVMEDEDEDAVAGHHAHRRRRRRSMSYEGAVPVGVAGYKGYSDYEYGITISGARRGRSAARVGGRWKKEEMDDDFGGFSVREEDEIAMEDEDEEMMVTRSKAKKSSSKSVREQEWDGMEMDMDMD